MARTLLALLVLYTVAVAAAAASFAESTLTMDEFTRGKLSVSIPLSVTIPSNLVPFDPEAVSETWWVGPKEAERLREGYSTSGATAHFTAKVTRNMGYDSKLNTFRGGTSTETTMASELVAAGMRDVTVKRHSASGYPILIVEATNQSGQRTRLAYVAMKIGSNVLLLYMTPSSSNGAADAQVWESFKKSLLGD
jgi:hypothetical protein